MGDIVSGLTGQDGANKQARRLANRRPVSLTAGGLSTEITGSRGNRRLTVTPSARRTALVGDIQDVLATNADELADLRTGVGSPLGQLRTAIGAGNEARIERIRAAERRAVGDLRQNLARRRVLGSSFAQDAIARARTEFGRELSAQEAEAAKQEAAVALEELNMRTQLIERESALRAQVSQTALDELNLQTEIGSQLAQNAEQTFQRGAELRLQTAQEAASGTGELIGTLGGAFLGNAGLFGGGGDGDGDGGSGLFGGGDDGGSDTGETLGSAAGSAIGGYFFGPMGAQAGGAIGGAIGSNVG